VAAAARAGGGELQTQVRRGEKGGEEKGIDIGVDERGGMSRNGHGVMS
jgi:hypothetical protein